MTGAPVVTVELDDATNSGTWPYDISVYVKLAEGWSTSRGRRDEETDVDAGTLDLVLNNPDGRFTLGSPLGVATYGLRKDQRIRLSETVGGTLSRRGTGYVRDWPLSWPTPVGNYGHCRVGSSDVFARWDRRKLLSQLEHEVLRDAPVAYYPMSEAAAVKAGDPVSVGDRSGKGAPSLGTRGSGAVPVLGSDPAPGFDGLTAVTFAGGKYLATSKAAALVAGVPYTVEFWVRVPTAPAGERQILAFGNTSSSIYMVFGVNAAGQLTCTLSQPTVTFTPLSTFTPIADGAWHHVAVTFDGVTPVPTYVDKVSVAGEGAAPTDPINYVSVGGATISSGTPASFTGSVAGLAIYPTVLSAARRGDHYTAGVDGFTTEGTAARVARLASYAGFTDIAAETGVLTSVAAAATSGQSLRAAIADVVKAEGGVAFIDGGGQLKVHNRTHRALKATGTPAVAVPVDVFDHDQIEWSASPETYLANTATASRAGGAEQRVVNETSKGKYEEYPGPDMSGLLVTTDQQALDAITWLVNNYNEPRPRIPALVTVNLYTLDQATVQALLALELGDRITVTAFPGQSPSATGDLIVEGIAETQTLSESSSDWRLTFNTAPADLFRAWVLGDATYGALGTTTKLHY